MQGTATNVYGFYSLTLDEGNYNLQFSFMGYQMHNRNISLTQNMKININMEANANMLREVVITEQKNNEKITSTEMGNTKLSSKKIEKIPVIFGEVDPLKVLKLLPGVQSTGEMSSNFSVRGGDKDQNLIQLDEATVYNASHMLGMFSVFNNDAIKNLDFYKGNIPARYGGRLSSVLDIRMNEGNMKKISGKGGIGLISSRLTLEGPVMRDKSSFIVSGRRTYLDFFNKFAKSEEQRNSGLHFHDLNAKLNYNLNTNNRLFISMYQGRDKFGTKAANSKFNFNWGNITATMRWNHQYNEKLFSNVTAAYSSYDYGIYNDVKEKKKNKYGEMEEYKSEFDWKAKLTDYCGKIDFVYYRNPENTIRFGMQSVYHVIEPGGITIKLNENKFEFKMDKIDAIENSVYAENEMKIGALININYGLRLSNFSNIYKNPVYRYNEKFEIKDTLKYSKNEIYNSNYNL